jgi:hypothetical protein
MKHYEYIIDILIIGGGIGLFGCFIYGIFDLLKTAIECAI